MWGKDVWEGDRVYSTWVVLRWHCYCCLLAGLPVREFGVLRCVGGNASCPRSALMRLLKLAFTCGASWRYVVGRVRHSMFSVSLQCMLRSDLVIRCRRKLVRLVTESAAMLKAFGGLLIFAAMLVDENVMRHASTPPGVPGRAGGAEPLRMDWTDCGRESPTRDWGRDCCVEPAVDSSGSYSPGPRSDPTGVEKRSALPVPPLRFASRLARMRLAEPARTVLPAARGLLLPPPASYLSRNWE